MRRRARIPYDDNNRPVLVVVLPVEATEPAISVEQPDPRTSAAQKERLHANSEAPSVVEAELAAAEKELFEAEARRISAYRLHGMGHIVDVPDDEYERHAQTQALTPVLLTTRDQWNWWWYAGRFWWENEGLDADDVQALVLKEGARVTIRVRKLGRRLRQADAQSDDRRRPRRLAGRDRLARRPVVADRASRACSSRGRSSTC